MMDHKNYWGNNFLHRLQVFSTLDSKSLAFWMPSLWHFGFQHFAILANTHRGDNFLIPKQVFGILDTKSFAFWMAPFWHFGCQHFGSLAIKYQGKFRGQQKTNSDAKCRYWIPTLWLFGNQFFIWYFFWFFIWFFIKRSRQIWLSTQCKFGWKI